MPTGFDCHKGLLISRLCATTQIFFPGRKVVRTNNRPDFAPPASIVLPAPEQNRGHSTGSCVLSIGCLKPIFFMRENKVVGLTPKSSAAPSTPLILQPAFCSTAKRFSRSRRRISDSVRYSGSGRLPPCGSKGARSIEEPFTGRLAKCAPWPRGPPPPREL